MKRSQGLYFEEFEPNVLMESEERMITEEDILQFAHLTGDTNPLHTNAEIARTGPFGRQIAHGMLGLSFAVGMGWQLGILQGTVLAFTNVDWKFRAPIYIGDVVCLKVKVKKKKHMPATGGGIVIFDATLVNQNDVVTQKGTWTIMVRSRPVEEE